ncbi:CYFA0S10e01508g1_1 [Cyberlindnera fabianii]|uniref:CYFA0S10e01508g1_1 n=1 Tax=Cyberlindnera fabianii TaxID=36022 RepID=A0A061B748_CYBFA|nr:CYFA0S10e01508g1_1 [Cyberlindnera fabianii]
MLLKPSKNIRGDLPLTPNNFYFTFQEFVITWLNIITYERHLYPTEAFEHRNSFNIRVPYNRHPRVQKWQTQLISDVMDDLVFKNTRKIKMVIYDEQTGEIEETYTIHLQEFLHVSRDYYDKEIKDLKTDWIMVYNEFRANLYTLITEIRRLKPLSNTGNSTLTSDNSTRSRPWAYNIVLETQNVSMNTNWVLDKPSEANILSKSDTSVSSSANSNGDQDDVNDDGKTLMTPLQFVDVGPIVFYSSIETRQR